MPRKIEGIEDAILLETIKQGAEVGINRISTLKIAKNLKITEVPIFYNFKTKDNLLLNAFFFIDKKIDEALSEYVIDYNDIISSIYRLWRTYINFFINNKFIARFYFEYRSSNAYNLEVAIKQSEMYPNFLSYLADFSSVIKSDVLESLSTSIFWDYIISNTLIFAIRINEDKCSNDENTLNIIFNLIFCFLK